MPPPYRKAKSPVLFLIVAVFLSNIVGLLWAAALPKSVDGERVFVMAGSILGLVAASFIVINLRERKRRGAVGQVLESEGYVVTGKPDRTAFGPFESLIDWAGWQRGKIQWVARAGDRLVLEHRFVTGSGKSSQEHIHTVYAVFDPSCARLNGLELARPVPFERRTLRKLHTLFKTGDEAFDREWMTMRRKGATKELELTGAFREALTGCPKGEAWSFGDEWAVCTFKYGLDADNVGLFLDHAKTVVRAI